MNINLPIRMLLGVVDKTLPTGQKVISVKFMTWEDDTEHRINLIPSPNPQQPADIERIN